MNKRRAIQVAAVAAVILILIGLWALKRSNTEAKLAEPVVTATTTAAADTAVTSSSSAEQAGPVVQETSAAEVEVGAAVGTSGAATVSDTTTPAAVETATAEAAEVEPLFVEEIDEDALRALGKPVMIQFFSTSCVPCMSMMDDLRAFYSENYGDIKVIALNVEEHPEAASPYPVVAVPTQLFMTASGEWYQPSRRIRASVGNWAEFTWRDTGELAYVVHQGVLSLSQMERIAAEAGGL